MKFGDIVVYLDAHGAARMPAIIRAVNADGTYDITVFGGATVPHNKIAAGPKPDQITPRS